MGARRDIMRRRGAAGGAALLLAAFGTVGAAGNAWADDADGDGTCAAVVISTTGDGECFDTALAAFESATDGTVDQADLDAAAAGDPTALGDAVEEHNDAVASASGSGSSAGIQALSATTATTATSQSLDDGPILGALWKDKNYMGEVAILQGASGSGCYGVTYGFPHAKSFGMNDEISSVATYSGCAVTLYKDANYKGTSLTIQVESPYVGKTMNDQTSSVVFRPRS